jgi:hypothetical protein
LIFIHIRLSQLQELQKALTENSLLNRQLFMLQREVGLPMILHLAAPQVLMFEEIHLPLDDVSCPRSVLTLD